MASADKKARKAGFGAMRLKTHKVERWFISIEKGDGRGSYFTLTVTESWIRRLRKMKVDDKLFLSPFECWVMRTPTGLLKVPWMTSDDEIYDLEALYKK
jgi:hypothetical protein